MMKRIKQLISYLAIFISAFFITGTSCIKETIVEQEVEILEPYILSLEEPIESSDSVYFVKVKFDNSELYYSLADTNIKLYSVSGHSINLTGKGHSFRNKLTNESIQIMFWAPDEDSSFSFQSAIYRFSNFRSTLSGKSVSGANVAYYTPARTTGTLYQYVGTNTTDSYFRVTWYDEDRICGEFNTKLVECCGDLTVFWVSGNFMIPRINF